ncbi:MAG: PTS fructose transporter subunit IIA [Rhizobacter sp.]|jgi:PTS system ascorbate-specific IIA component|nr:PTS fructose transporter subunit IIA [Burkholderiaceae bacterium]MCO5123151.1 PTS fructose transporter subunit IIA [Rhizobacter sp.]
MPGILIIAHAPLASALKSVAMHAYPDCARRIEALDVAADESVDAVEVKARALLQRVLSPDALVFTDVFGATPCNAAQRLADNPHVKVLAGVSIPMLWRCLCYETDALDAMVARAMNGAIKGVMQVATTRPQNQTLRSGGDDQDHHHHQQ